MKQYHLFKYANGKSLAEINGSVEVPKNKGFWRTLLAYTGPGALVAVGYMDPGNWATSINGGQSFQFLLILATLITILDVLFLLFLSKVGFRKIEILVLCLIFVILFIFAYEVILSRPNWMNIGVGLLPSSEMLAKTPVIGGISPLSGSLGIIGATVMPHNFYLHSGICQVRKISSRDPKEIRQAVKYTEADSNIQLTIAFIINSLLLIMGAAVFKSGAVQDNSFFGLYDALNDTAMLSNSILINVAKTGVLSTLFAIALLASGQNSTITGTLTGQLVMEGFIHLNMPMWARRLITWLFSVIPVIICVSLTAKDSIARQHFVLNMLMENSQVFLAFAVPFTIIPLLILTDSKKLMGEFANNYVVSILGWSSSLILIFLNLYNLPETFVTFNFCNPDLAKVVAYLIIAIILFLLVWTCVEMLGVDISKLRRKFVLSK